MTTNNITTTNLQIRKINPPPQPGVYLFYNQKNELIYIGKATSLKSRVKSYFQGNQKTFRPIEEMISEVKKVKWQVTNSVLEAIILEARLIKEKQPKYNVLGKDDKSWNYLVITKDEYPKLIAVREHELVTTNNESTTNLRIELRKQKNKKTTLLRQGFGGQEKQEKGYKKIFGPFPHLRTQDTLKLLRKLFHYSTCKPNSERACFYRQIDQCYGVCTGEISVTEYKKRVIKPLTLFLSGKTKQVITELTKQMKEQSKNHFFEEAAILRNQIENLKHIQDVALIDKSFFQIPVTSHQSLVTSIRIEGYDISNFGNSGIVGSMVVFNQNEPQKADYRLFKIKSLSQASDVEALEEMITRRLKHSEWPLPNYILVDGGKPQVNRVKQVIRENKLNIPVIGIAKGPDRKKNEFIFAQKDSSLNTFVAQNENLLIRVRDEAHRFAIGFQKKQRKIH